MTKRLTLSLLVPCFNEERSLEASLLSCLNQTRVFDQIVFVDDCSNDNTAQILARYRGAITAVRTPHNTGNKSSAQEYGLQFVTGDILVTTDADTLLHPRFAERIEEDFAHPHVAAVAGYVESLPYNWLTLCRAYYYVIGQDIHKIAQHYLNYIFVMPGAASAFRTDVFRTHITFDHDTITEDLDFTYKLHRNDLQILYDRRAISYTQDPTTLSDYVNQMRRWYSGGWQNLVKHIAVVDHPQRALELSLIYIEGLAFSFLILILPIINPVVALQVMAGYLVIVSLFALWAAIISKRADILLAPIPFLLLMYVNAWIFLETFVKEIIMRRRTLIWFKPGRTDIPVAQGRPIL
jgi:cellulose synthase/poly-beta-1,6-N-acetylglucosamine synthase-like glycosyltransferase